MSRIWKSNPPAITLNTLNGRDIPDDFNDASLTTSSQGSFDNMPHFSFENPVDVHRNHIDTDLDASSQESLNQMLRSLDVLVEDPVDPYYINTNVVETRSQDGANERRIVGAAVSSSTHLRREDTLLANGPWTTASSALRRQDTLPNNGPWTASSSTRLKRQDTLPDNEPWSVGAAAISGTRVRREDTLVGEEAADDPLYGHSSTSTDDLALCDSSCIECQRVSEQDRQDSCRWMIR